jgi:hypothetical protein
MQVIMLADVDYGSVVVLTPDVDDATVFIGDQPFRIKTRKGRLLLSSLRPSTQTFRVDRDGYCTVGPDTSITLTLKAGEQKEARFVLKPLPQLKIENAPEKAEFSVSPSSQWNPVSGALPLQPGSYDVIVRAEGYVPVQRTVELTCGMEVQLVHVQMQPPRTETKVVTPRVIAKSRVAYQLTPPDAKVDFYKGDALVAQGSPSEIDPGSYTIKISAEGFDTAEESITLTEGVNPPIKIELNKVAPAHDWPVGCFKKNGEWEISNSDCFFSTDKAPGTYTFEIQGKTDAGKAFITFGAKKVLHFGPWFIGTPSHFVECVVDGEAFRWRVPGAKWVEGAKFKQPVTARSLHIQAQVSSGSAVVTITAEGGDDSISSRFGVPNEGFGLKGETSIRAFHYAKQ